VDNPYQVKATDHYTRLVDEPAGSTHTVRDDLPQSFSGHVYGAGRERGGEDAISDPKVKLHEHERAFLTRV
jgi:hypothetical protein